MNELNSILIFYPQIQKILTIKIVSFVALRYTVKEFEINLSGMDS